MALEPSFLQVLVTCPGCMDALTEALVTPHSQYNGPQVKQLREAYDAHVIAVVKAGKPGRKLLMRCPHDPRSKLLVLDGDAVSLGAREVAEANARTAVALADGGGKSKNGPTGPASATTRR